MTSGNFSNSYTRRGFLSRATRFGVGLSAAAALRDLQLISTASAQSPVDDYKALICIFLSGGNDSDNTIVDQANIANYTTIRNHLAIEFGPGNLITGSGSNNYYLHPSLTDGIKVLYGEGKAAAVFNVGPMLRPIITAADLLSGAPPQLFSHNDQALQWQTSVPDGAGNTGWGGRLTELKLDGISAQNANRFANVSLAGTNIFQTGSRLNPFSLSTMGAPILTHLSGLDVQTTEWHGAFQNVIDARSSNLQSVAYAGALSNAIGTGKDLNSVLVTLPDTFPATALGNQLKMVARMIATHGTLGVQRQTFFTQVGSYDTHGGQVADGSPATGTHADLLKDLSDAVLAFQRTMERLGLADKVVSFTASDFGRTFLPNGLGSDHGWGGHHFVFGGTGGSTGAVKGGTYGSHPSIHLGNSDYDYDDGRWIPKIAVDEYSATLAKWFGVGNDGLDTIFPNLKNFNHRDLGFLNA